MLRTNTQTDADERFTPATVIGVSNYDAKHIIIVFAVVISNSIIVVIFFNFC